MTNIAPIDPTTGQSFTAEQIAAFQAAAQMSQAATQVEESKSAAPQGVGDLPVPQSEPTELDKALADAVQGVDCAAAAAEGVAAVAHFSTLEELAGAFVVLQKTVHALEDHHARLDEAVSAIKETMQLVPAEFWQEVHMFWDKIVNMFGVRR